MGLVAPFTENLKRFQDHRKFHPPILNLGKGSKSNQILAIRRFAFDSAVSCHSAANYTPLSRQKGGLRKLRRENRSQPPPQNLPPTIPLFSLKVCNFEQSHHGGPMYSEPRSS